VRCAQSDSALLCVAEALPNLKHLLMTESAGFGDAGMSKKK
jgi:hypothetical protein